MDPLPRPHGQECTSRTAGKGQHFPVGWALVLGELVNSGSFGVSNLSKGCLVRE